MKLTAPRRKLLEEACSGTYCSKVYSPANFLVLYKLAVWRDDDEFDGKLLATEAGRSRLSNREDGDV